jgi:hypothetical protein
LRQACAPEGLVVTSLVPFSGFTMLLFAWKAAVFPAWGTALFAVAVAVIVGHVMLPLRQIYLALKGAAKRRSSSPCLGANILI